MRARPWLALWILGILFPIALLGRLWPAFDRTFVSLFAPTWTHILMHGLLFAVLGFMLAGRRRGSPPLSPVSILGIALLIGGLQEAIQLLAAGNRPMMTSTGVEAWGAQLFDLGVDCMGAAAGLLSARGLERRAARRADSQSRSPACRHTPGKRDGTI